MRKSILSGTSVKLWSLLLLVGIAHAQFQGVAHRVQLLPTKLVSQLGAASSFPGYMVRVSDGNSASDCTVGGGATQVICWSNGTVWAALGGGGGGTTINPTNNVIPKRSNATTFVDSALTDNGTTVSSTEPILAPASSNCSNTPFGFNATPSYGVDQGAVQGVNAVIICAGGIPVATFQQQGSGLILNTTSGTGLRFSSGNPINSAPDASVDRLAASTLVFGSGGLNAEDALIRWSVCRVTADITLSTSPTNVCSFSNLPGVAKPWSWSCPVVLWSVTAGTTPTLTIGVNPSQTPTGTTNAWAELKTTNANVATEAAVSLSASGNTNILTTPTLTTAATIFSGSTYGTLLASGAPGSFAITMTGTGAGFAGVARAGTTCWLF